MSSNLNKPRYHYKLVSKPFNLSKAYKNRQEYLHNEGHKEAKSYDEFKTSIDKLVDSALIKKKDGEPVTVEHFWKWAASPGASMALKTIMNEHADVLKQKFNLKATFSHRTEDDNTSYYSDHYVSVTLEDIGYSKQHCSGCQCHNKDSDSSYQPSTESDDED
uniref:Uncharacterized protein n=1 Tax=viral metagenome TaxID=1070528 RepID=A0A6C0CJJ5_9ZZZZ